MTRMTWTYHDVQRRPIFEHYRVSVEGGRGKKYGYRYPIDVSEATGRVYAWDYHKHPLADTLLYRLPELLDEPTWNLYWVEGERDADCLRELDVLATSHHGGAGKATRAQAEWLRGRTGKIILVADCDPPGAYCAVRRYDLLRGIGIPAKQIEIVRAPHWSLGADVRDHLESGGTLDELVACKRKKLRRVAATVTPKTFFSWSYVTPEELESSPDIWKVTRRGAT